MEIKNLIGKATKGIASTAQKLKDKFVRTYDKVNEKIEQQKKEKAKKDYIISAFESKALPFVIYFKDGKTKDVKCLYDFDAKTLKLNLKVDKEKTLYFKDSRNQEYYIQDIDLNGDMFTCEYEGEVLSLQLEKVIFTTVKPIAPTVNNYSMTDNSIHNDNSIKAKNSNINSDDASISNENSLGLHAHLPK